MRPIGVTLVFGAGLVLGFGVMTSWLAVLCSITLFAVFYVALTAPADRARRIEVEQARRRHAERTQRLNEALQKS